MKIIKNDGVGTTLGAEIDKINDNFKDVIANLLKQQDSSLIFQGFAKPTDDTPAATVNHAYYVIESGTVFDVAATEGQVLVGNGSGFGARTISGKADHGYESNPKTLKEVDTLATQNAEDITQLAGDKAENLLFSKATFPLSVKNLIKEIRVNKKTNLNNLYIYRISHVLAENAMYMQFSTIIDGVETVVLNTAILNTDLKKGIVTKSLSSNIPAVVSGGEIVLDFTNKNYGLLIDTNTALSDRELNLNYVIDTYDYLVDYNKANENSIFTPRLTHSNKDRETAIHKAFKKIALSSKYVHQSNRLYVNYLSLTVDRMLTFRIKIIGEEHMFYVGSTPIPESGIIERVLYLSGTPEEVGYVILDASQFKYVGIIYVPTPTDPYNNEILKWSLIHTEEEEEDYAVKNENRLHQLGLITLPRQLADNSSYITDGYLTATGGVVQTPDYYITDWISVKPNTRYKYIGQLRYSRVCIGADINFKNIHAVVNASQSSTPTLEEIFTTSDTTYYVKLCTLKTVDSGLWEVDTTINESGHPEYDTVDEMITNHDGRRYAKVGSVIFECMSETPTSIKDFRQINGEKRRVENRWILKESKQLNINGDSAIFSCVDNFDNIYSGTRLSTKEFCNLYKNDDVLYDFGANKKVMQVTPLGNGELMALIEDNTGQQSIWVSSAGASVFTQKFMTSWVDSSNRGRVEGGWGIDAYENIIVVAEYGTHSVSKYVWLSDNYGETFKVLLNVNTDLLSDGTPILVNLPKSHIHGAFYDPYWERVWVIYADGDNSSILFTDNWGDEIPTWHRNSITTLKWGGAQTVCGKAFPDFILLGSDANYCGVYRLNRTSKKNNLKIEFVHDVMNEGDWELAQASPNSKKTYVGGNVYQRNYEQPILLSFHRHSYLEDWAKPNLVATYDGINFTNIYQFDNVDWGMIVNTDSKGNIYVRPSQDSTRLIILEKK